MEGQQLGILVSVWSPLGEQRVVDVLTTTQTLQIGGDDGPLMVVEVVGVRGSDGEVHHSGRWC